MIKAAIEDILKGRQDKQRNLQPVTIYRDGDWRDVAASEIHVGDILRMDKDDLVPSDLLYIGSDEPSKLCYYSEMNLNGETAVKTMNCYPLFRDCDPIEFLKGTSFMIDVPEPDPDLTHFDAKLRSGNSFWPISIHNVLLRGTSTHYTEKVLGIVLRTGHDTKIMRNVKHPPAKLSSFDRTMNALLILIFIVHTVLVLASAGIGAILERRMKFGWIRALYPSGFEAFANYMLQYLILYSYLIPVSLSVTIEFLRLYHTILIDWDPDIYDPDFGTATARASNQIVQLGLVTHVLTDKTGTLTENDMQMLEFWTPAGIYVATDFVEDLVDDDQLFNDNLHFLIALAVCNNVIVHPGRDGALEYRADSPDEAAFVSFAAECGVKLISRRSGDLTLDIRGTSKVFRILAHIPFDAQRKRMSLLVEAEGESPILFCKGADQMMMHRVSHYSQSDIVCEFATAGLRTLIFTSRIIGGEELEIWLPAYEEDAAALIHRDERVAARGEDIEVRLDVIGVSAVEDRLQQDVPRSIRWLRDAGLKIWMLTGDKLETAIAIGRTSGLMRQRSDPLVIAADDEATVKRKLQTILEEFGGYRAPVLVVTERAVELCLGKNVIEEFMKVADKMTSVILARVSPLMKSQVVAAVKETGSMTLAIGDGANDTEMIQVAHVGVGVYGREGSQAAQSADFAIPRFRHLIRLLAVHGHWTYNRFSVAAMMQLYKNFMFILNQTWFTFDTLGSPTSLFNDFCLGVFNLVFTLVPPFAYGGWNQDLPQDVLLARPPLYAVAENAMAKVNLIWVFLLSIWQSASCYFSVRWTMGNDSLQVAGVVCYLTCVFMVIIQLLLWSDTLTSVTLTAYIVNVLAIPIVLYLYMGVFSHEMRGDLQGSLTRLFPWLGILVAMVVGLLPGFTAQYIKNRFFPSKARLVRERLYAHGLDSLIKPKTNPQLSETDFGLRSSTRKDSMQSGPI
jgi:phospholipid-transporting ATPase